MDKISFQTIVHLFNHGCSYIYIMMNSLHYFCDMSTSPCTPLHSYILWNVPTLPKQEEGLTKGVLTCLMTDANPTPLTTTLSYPPIIEPQQHSAIFSILNLNNTRLPSHYWTSTTLGYLLNIEPQQHSAIFSILNLMTFILDILPVTILRMHIDWSKSYSHFCVLNPYELSQNLHARYHVLRATTKWKLLNTDVYPLYF